MHTGHCLNYFKNTSQIVLVFIPITNMKKIFVCIVLNLTATFTCSSYIADVDEQELKQSDFQPSSSTEIDANRPQESECKCPKFPRPVDCSEVLANGNNVSGVYTVYPKSRAIDCDTLEVYCDMDTDGGGWTVIQRRGDFKNGQNYFVKNWQTYKTGFGNLKKEFWLGNDNIHAITNQDSYSARFDLRRTNGDAAFALYDTFALDDEERNYRLHILEYSGTAGDAISNHHLSLFYTLDRPNFPAGRKAGDTQHQGGWWLNTFPSSNLNGLNKQGADKGGERNGIVWKRFAPAGFMESLGFTEIKLRPKRFN